MDKIGNSIVATSIVDLQHEHAYKEAAKNLLEQLGGMNKFVSSGMKVLLKPDMFSQGESSKSQPTSPQLIKAIASEVQDCGGEVYIGDSPFVDNGTIEGIWEKCGLIDIAQKNNYKLVNFEKYGSRAVVFETDVYYISRFVLDIDLVINLPKLRLDPITRFSGAINNLIGVIPGNHKSKVLQHANSSKIVAQKLSDLAVAVAPALTIMDAVNLESNKEYVSAEKLLLASTDFVALDVVAGIICGIDEVKNIVTRVASESGLGIGFLDYISVTGVLEIKNLKYPKNYSFISKLSDSFQNLVNTVNYSYQKFSPRIVEEKCDNCHLCSKLCPTKALEVEQETNKLRFKDAMCINCWCCRENCPNNAIEANSVLNIAKNRTIYRKNCVV